MTTFELSTIIGAVGCAGQLIAVRSAIIGWTISVAIQPLWYAFYLTVGGWPLIPLSTVYAAAALLHLRKGLRARGVTLRQFPAYATTQTTAWVTRRGWRPALAAARADLTRRLTRRSAT